MATKREAWVFMFLADAMPARVGRRWAFLLLMLWGVSAWATTVLTFAHTVSPDHPRAKAARFFAEQVKQATRGRVLVEVVGLASLGDADLLLKAVQNGSLDMSASSQAAMSALVPEFNVLSLPFLFPDVQSAWRVLDGELGESLSRQAADKGVVLLGFWDSGMRHFSNSVRPLLKPADFAGLRIRTPSDQMTAEIVRALGGQPKTVNYSEIYDALKRGAIDGQENPLVNFVDARLYEVQKYLSLTGHRYSTSPLIISRISWDGLSAGDRKALSSAAREATRFQRNLIQSVEESTVRQLSTLGVRVDRVDTQSFALATAPLYERWYSGPQGHFVRQVVKTVREGK